MKRFALISLSVVSVFSCKEKSPASQNDCQRSTDFDNVEICYESVSDNDTIKLSVITNGKNITGSLMSENPASGISSGTISGTQSGDTLKVNLRSFSEGKVLFREVYFLQKNNQLIQAAGIENRINDSTYVYNSPSAITYGQNLIYQKVDCPKY